MSYPTAQDYMDGTAVRCADLFDFQVFEGMWTTASCQRALGHKGKHYAKFGAGPLVDYFRHEWTDADPNRRANR